MSICFGILFFCSSIRCSAVCFWSAAHFHHAFHDSGAIRGTALACAAFAHRLLREGIAVSPDPIIFRVHPTLLNLGKAVLDLGTGCVADLIGFNRDGYSFWGLLLSWSAAFGGAETAVHD